MLLDSFIEVAGLRSRLPLISPYDRMCYFHGIPGFLVGHECGADKISETLELVNRQALGQARYTQASTEIADPMRQHPPSPQALSPLIRQVTLLGTSSDSQELVGCVSRSRTRIGTLIS